MQPAIGRSLSRIDGPAKVTGRARFVPDVKLANLAHAALVRSTVSAGRIVAIDASAAGRAPGVLAVLTHENFPRLAEAPVLLEAGGDRTQPKGSAGQKLLPMQSDRVEYAGQLIAVVVADDLERAQFAASLVRVKYEAEPFHTELDLEAVPPFKPKDVWGDETDYHRGDAERGLRDAAAVVDATYHTAVQHHVTMEPAATTAHWDGGRLTIYETTTWVGGTRKTVAAWFGLRPEDVRVVNEYVGGSFGSKGPTWPHVAVCVAAARHVGRPVRLELTRAQTFTDQGHRPKIRHRIRLGATADGRLTAFTYDALAACPTFDDRVVAPVTRTVPRLYACENVATSYRLARVNRPGPFTMRGPGEAPGMFALESAMDELAYALNIDPVELRLRNDAPQDPTERQPWSSRHLKECLRQAADRFGWSRRTPRPGSMRDAAGRAIGWGVASMIYDARAAGAKATVTLRADGGVVVRTATCDQGAGSRTALAQIAADTLGTDPGRVTVELGDTDLPPAPIQAASHTTAGVGTAVARAAENLLHRLKDVAARAPGSPLAGRTAMQLVAEDGRIHVKGDADPSRSIAVTDVLSRAGAAELTGEGQSQAIRETQGVSRFSFGAHIAEVTVEPRTCEVRVTRYVAAFAAGRIVNPKLARSQLLGGIVWGIGMALMEETRTDRRSGRWMNQDLAEYLVPTCADVPSAIEALFVEERDEQVNPLGVKGVGEIGVIGSAAAIANAVYHATGRRVRDLPITPDKLL